MSQLYQQAGVNIQAGDEAVERLKPLARSVTRPEVISGLGGFGGLFRLNTEKYKKPILVSGTDGVGTKLKLAFALDQHNTVGIDLVAMCVNDIAVSGAEPLYFLDYIACSQLLPEKIESIVSGIAEGCRQAGCALLGGETAEMPGMYAENEYDLAGFAVGAVEEDQLIDGSQIKPGDCVLGFPSSGVHSNGFSLVRRIVENNHISWSDPFPGSNETIGNTLLIPTRIYIRLMQKLMSAFVIKGWAHITGGGITGNVPRILPDNTSVQFFDESWPILPVFSWLQKKGNVAFQEMFEIFNMGVGLIAVVDPMIVEELQKECQQLGEPVYIIGKIIPGENQVILPKEGL